MTRLTTPDRHVKLAYVPVCFCTAVGKHWPELSGKKEFTGSLLHFTVHHWGNSEQKLQVATWHQELKQRPWRSHACSPWLAQPAFIYDPGPLAQERHHTQWVPSTSIVKQENAHKYTHRLIWEGKFLSQGSLFLGDSSVCQRDKNLTSKAYQKNICTSMFITELWTRAKIKNHWTCSLTSE